MKPFSEKDLESRVVQILSARLPKTAKLYHEPNDNGDAPIKLETKAGKVSMWVKPKILTQATLLEPGEGGTNKLSDPEKDQYRKAKETHHAVVVSTTVDAVDWLMRRGIVLRG